LIRYETTSNRHARSKNFCYYCFDCNLWFVWHDSL